jgi:hypothetical protein
MTDGTEFVFQDPQQTTTYCDDGGGRGVGGFGKPEIPSPRKFPPESRRASYSLPSVLPFPSVPIRFIARDRVPVENAIVLFHPRTMCALSTFFFWFVFQVCRSTSAVL